MAELFKHLTPGLGLSHDLTIREFEPYIGLSNDHMEPAFSLEKKKKLKKKDTNSESRKMKSQVNTSQKKELNLQKLTLMKLIQDLPERDSD